MSNSRNINLKSISIALIFISIISGKFSFDRLLTTIEHFEWLEMRLWFIFAAFVTYFASAHTKESKGWEKEKGAMLYFLGLLLLCGYFIGNILIIGNSQIFDSYLVDMLYVVASLILISIVFRSEPDIVVYAKVSEILGVFLFLLCLLGFGNPDLNGHAWAPFGGPITMYRIEFLAFCSALYLYALTRPAAVSSVHLLIAGISLFSTLATFSKAALLGAVAVILLFLFWLLALRETKKAFVVIFVVIPVSLFFHFYKGSIMMARIEDVAKGLRVDSMIESKAGGGQRQQLTFRDSIVNLVKDYNNGKIKTFKHLSHDQREKIIAYITISNLSSEQKRNFLEQLRENRTESKVLPNVLEYISRIVIITDNSTRITMALKALDALKTNTWFGIGMGNYHTLGINKYSKSVEEYRYPHNIILEVTATTGLVGLLLFCSLMFGSFILMVQRLLANKLVLFLLGYPVFVFVTALYSGDIYDFRLFWYVVLIIIFSFPPNARYAKASSFEKPILN